MNILFSSDDNYAQHMGVAIYSILLHNKRADKIHFYVINNKIDQLNICKIESVVNNYENADITFIAFDSFEKQLHLHLLWPISLSSYARLFIGEILPSEVDRVLYLDCDIVVNGPLYELWNTNLHDKYLGAIQDTIPPRTKSSVGLLPQQPYFNAGVLLLDLKQWRENRIGEKCLDFIKAHDGRVTHHDQGVLNGLLKDKWERLPLKYNVMTVHYMFSQSKIRNFYKDEASFYDSSEIKTAIKNPFVIHFTPSFTNRPWEKYCNHPLKNLYQALLKTTPWNGTPLIHSSNPWYVNLINVLYRYFPIF